MLSLKLKQNEIDFIFSDFFTKKHIHSEDFDWNEAKSIAKNILQMIKEGEKIMDKAIKSEKQKIDKGMNKLVKMDVKRDKACDAAMKKKKK